MVAAQKLDGSSSDILNIFDSAGDRRPFRRPIAAALLCHLLILLLRLPSITPEAVIQSPFRIVNIRFPQAAATAAGNESSPAVDRGRRPSETQAQIPIPMPLLREAVPIRQWPTMESTLEDFETSIQLGPVLAPPRGRTGDRPGVGGNRLKGDDSPHRKAEPVYSASEASPPHLITSTLPSYTNEAIRAKVQGIVLLEGIVRANGRIDSIRVVRGLGYGLDESAILEISKNWRFRPGMRSGRPVNVRALIEVRFSLR